MARSDIPYALLTLFFGVAIFIAGRWSAPVTTTVIRETVQTAPSLIIVPTAAPVGARPEASEAPKVAPTPSQVPVKAPKLGETTIKTAPKPVPSIHVELEETPEDVKNPYTP